MVNLNWMDSAGCKIPGTGYNRAMFEPLHREMRQAEQDKANEHCKQCAVFDQCLAWAAESTIDPLPYAFAAGMTSRQRQIYRHLISGGNATTCVCVSCRNRQRRSPDGESEQTQR